MTRSKLLANRIREVLLDGTWIANTNYKMQIEGLTWEQATQKHANFNTIAQLTFHINYYLQGVLQVLEGGPLSISDKYSFDLPPISNEETWQSLVHNFLLNALSIVEHVELLNDQQLDAVFVDAKYGTYKRNLEGIIEHSYYHLGQVSLIKKMIKL